MKIQWDKSLYTKINSRTQKKLDDLNLLVQRHFPEEYENEWGNQTTLSEKANYLSKLNIARCGETP